MITLDEYLMHGRDLKYPDEYKANNVQANAEELLKRVNAFFAALNIAGAWVTSGWRPAEINLKYHGAPHSYHMVGKAIDIADGDGKLKELILNNRSRLGEFGLWMEDPAHTPTWVHLDYGDRPEREPRIFTIKA